MADTVIAPDTADIIERLGGPGPRQRRGPRMEVRAATSGDAALAAYRELRREWFCRRLGVFAEADDADDADRDPHTRVLIARDDDGSVLGGVRVHPVGEPDRLAWWRGGRLVAAPGAPRGVGSRLVRAACATVARLGALRFDATVLEANVAFFERLGWKPVERLDVGERGHRLMRWPLTGWADHAAASKAVIGPLVGALAPGGPGWIGDDAAPVAGSDLVATTDAVLPAMVAADPEWAGWCGILVGANDLAAMGAAPRGALDALACVDGGHAARVVRGLGDAAAAFALPILGGHTQLGADPALSVTALGATPAPVRAGGGRPGHALRLAADLAGGWRPGYGGEQWDSTSHRRADEIAALLGGVAREAPHAAKDVSMAGIVGTAGMLAEASGCGAEIAVDALPRPAGAAISDWVTCFPGYAMLSAAPPEHPLPPGPATAATVGRLVDEPGVSLVWPDGHRTPALAPHVTGLGAATGGAP